MKNKLLKHRLLNRISALVFATIFIFGCSTGKNKQKIVVLTFDDAVKSQLEFVAPLLKEKGFGATFFITNAWMDDTVNFMQWKDVATLYKMGFEIGNHSWDHEPLITEEALSGMEENLARVDSALLAHGIPRPVSFAYPGNFFVPQTVEKFMN